MSTSTSLQPLSLSLLPGDGLQSYLQQVNAVDLLTAEEEFRLAQRYREQSDLFAAQQLVLSHLRYVVKIARHYSGYGLALNDLIQEGSIGLMKAVKRFDPAMGVRLASFAVHWIKSEIHDFVIRNWRIVKVATTKAQRKLFFNLRQAKKRLGWFSQEEITELAKDLGVTPKEVMEMESRLSAQDDPYEQLGEEKEGVRPADYLPAAPHSDPALALATTDAEEKAQSRLKIALNSLESRSLDIVSSRWLAQKKASLKELADKYGVSMERIRQLEKNAIEKLRSLLDEE